MKVVAAAVAAIILAASLGYTFIVSGENHKNYDDLNTRIWHSYRVNFRF